jgi:hypothetical protein
MSNQIEIREAEHTEGPFTIATSNSWRRIVNERLEAVCVPVTQRSDGHPDLHFPNGGWNGPDAKLLESSADMSKELEEIIREAEKGAKTLREEGREKEAERLLQKAKEAAEVLNKARA